MAAMTHSFRSRHFRRGPSHGPLHNCDNRLESRIGECRNDARHHPSRMGFGGETTMSMSGTSSPRPMIPALAGTYATTEPLAYLLLRVVTGAMLIAHGWPKLMAGPAAVAANAMARRGIEPAYVVACIAIFLEN